ncbi:hypothetical protein WOC76_05080 [Methylocystis sp. IM3]|jgi:hypothetical protein|uniref:hypothetical protein n=1 Tax=unclassified Methylocystis TaxID=2625913 RepID=UPI000FBEF404|nr:MAG: hypothetical protein EKK29_03640 [Hyphomicrobiales bacterium]
MVWNPKLAVFGAVCGALLLASTPSISAVLSNAADLGGEKLALTSVQQSAFEAPAGKKCVKWTRRWNTRHGFGRRRCVQWR